MKPRTSRFRQAASTSAITVAVLVMLPLFGVAAFVMQFILLAVMIGVVTVGVAIHAFSPRFREWLRFKIEPGLTYNGLRLSTDVAVDRAHGWARFEGDRATVGVDDLAQTVLGPIEAVELPPPDTHVSRGQPLFRVHHGTRNVTFRSPVSGTVVDRNGRLLRDPRLINTSPFGGGWAVRVECDDRRADKRSLLRGGNARAWFRREVDRLLMSLAPAAAASSLPDGGAIVEGLYRQIDDATWTRIKNEFFDTRAGV